MPRRAYRVRRRGQSVDCQERATEIRLPCSPSLAHAPTGCPRGPGPAKAGRLGAGGGGLAFRSADRHALLARISPQQLDWDPAARSAASPTCRGWACSRTSGSAAARCAAGCPKAYADRPIYVFETGGSTGIPKSRINIEDFRTDYSMFSETLSDEGFPRGANWLMLGPFRPAAAAAGRRAPGPGPRRHLLLRGPRSAVGDPAHQAGPDRRGRGLQGARDPAGLTILRANHDIRCMFTTPKLLEALCEKISLKKGGHHAASFAAARK